MMSAVMPGTSFRAVDPMGSRVRRASTEDSGRPAAVAAAGMSLAAGVLSLDVDEDSLVDGDSDGTAYEASDTTEAYM